MNDINSYIIINRKTSPFFILFNIISFIIFFSLIIILNLYFTKNYKTYGQVVKDNTYKLLLYLSPYQLNIIKKNNKLTIDDLEYTYYIESISNEYVISNDNDYYLKVILDINLKEEDKIINNFLEVTIFESKKKLFYYLKDYFMEGEK